MPAHTEPQRHWNVTETLPLPGKFAIMVYRSDLIMRDGLDEIMILVDETCPDQPVVPRSWPPHERCGPLPPEWRQRIEHVLRDGDDDGGGR